MRKLIVVMFAAAVACADAVAVACMKCVGGSASVDLAKNGIAVLEFAK